MKSRRERLLLGDAPGRAGPPPPPPLVLTMDLRPGDYDGVNPWLSTAPATQNVNPSAPAPGLGAAVDGVRPADINGGAFVDFSSQNLSDQIFAYNVATGALTGTLALLMNVYGPIPTDSADWTTNADEASDPNGMHFGIGVRSSGKLQAGVVNQPGAASIVAETAFAPGAWCACFARWQSESAPGMGDGLLSVRVNNGAFSANVVWNHVLGGGLNKLVLGTNPFALLRANSLLMAVKASSAFASNAQCSAIYALWKAQFPTMALP